MRGGENARRTAASVDYLDFEVVIGECIGQEYTVTVQSPAGGAHERARFPFDEVTLARHLLDLQGVPLREDAAHRSALPVPVKPEEGAVAELGRVLFQALLPGQVLSRYEACSALARTQHVGMRLRLQIADPRLSALPWELLYDSQRAEYVCLAPHRPLVRHLEVSEPIESLLVEPPLRILGVAASPRDLPRLDVAEEQKRIEKELRPLQNDRLVELTWLTPPTPTALHDALALGRRPWHVFHFIGHGGINPQSGEGYLLLDNEEGDSPYSLSGTALGRLLAANFCLRLAVLNACEGARGDGRNVFSGTAAALVRKGLSAAVAMQYRISDGAAVSFAGGFYRALGTGFPVDGAVSVARQVMTLDARLASQSLAWATPVLYLRAPNALLVTPRPEQESPDRPPNAPSSDEVAPGVAEDPLSILATTYEAVRRSQRAGKARTDAMGAVADRMVAMVPHAKGFDPRQALKSSFQGTRLAGYVYLYVHPQPALLRDLVDNITGIECVGDKRFAQLWGIKALTSLIPQLRPSDIPPEVGETLTRYREGLHSGNTRSKALAPLMAAFGLLPDG